VVVEWKFNFDAEEKWDVVSPLPTVTDVYGSLIFLGTIFRDEGTRL
jgi:hypothetical protein